MREEKTRTPLRKGIGAERENAVFSSRIDRADFEPPGSLQEGGDQGVADIEQLEAPARRGKLRFPLLGSPTTCRRPAEGGSPGVECNA